MRESDARVTPRHAGREEGRVLLRSARPSVSPAAARLREGGPSRALGGAMAERGASVVGGPRGSAAGPSLLQPAPGAPPSMPQPSAGSPALAAGTPQLLAPPGVPQPQQPSASAALPAAGLGASAPGGGGGCSGGAPLAQAPPGSGSAAGGRPVQMNLYATWEVDRSSPSCVPR